MMSILKDVQPENVFRYFEEICGIPHGSYHTRAISNYLADFAKAHGLEYYQDDVDNVVMIKEATEGYEDAEPVIIQGHMDMVCEKEADSPIDFEKDGLDLYIDGDYLKARGTTLGGDDGIAVAYALAVLDDDTLEHPRLEVVITTNEEVGLIGAKEIDLSMLKGHILLNIDSEEEGHFLTSCAGGLSVNMKLPVTRTEVSGCGITLRLHQLEGGHSGSEIDKEHANAIIEMGRILKYIEERVPVSICALKGGLKDNAIPRDVSATIVAAKEDVAAVKEHAAKIGAILQKEYAVTEPNLTLTVTEEAEKEYSVLSPSSAQKVLFYFRNVPNGILHMSTDIKGLVETSLNAGIMELSEDQLYVSTSVRSSVGSRKEDLCDRLVYLSEFLGAEVDLVGDYPAWEYQKESKIRGKVADTWKQLFGEEPAFEAIHAGLECGLLSEKIPGLDAVAFGPDILDIHTPKEHLSLSSAKRVYEFLTALLKNMK